MASSSSPITPIESNTIATLNDTITRLQQFLTTQGFPQGYTITVGPTSFALDSNRYVDGQVAEMYGECVAPATPYENAPPLYPQDVHTSLARAIYLSKNIRRHRQNPRCRLTSLFDLDKILLQEMKHEDITELRRILG